MTAGFSPWGKGSSCLQWDWSCIRAHFGLKLIQNARPSLPSRGNAKPAQELAYLQLGLPWGCGVGAITQLIVST